MTRHRRNPVDPQTVDQNYAVTGAGFGIGDDIINKIF
jgi:hypothetical protein